MARCQQISVMCGDMILIHFLAVQYWEVFPTGLHDEKGDEGGNF